MKWTQILKFIGEAIPVIGEFLGFIADLPDKEWESISKAWPAPTKTKMARLRAETKAMKHFFGEE